MMIKKVCIMCDKFEIKHNQGYCTPKDEFKKKNDTCEVWMKWQGMNILLEDKYSDLMKHYEVE